MNKSNNSPEHGQAQGQHTADSPRTFTLRLVPALAAMSLAFGAQAQSNSNPQTLTVSTTDGPVPYVLTAGPNIARGISAKCIRSSYWTLELAKTVKIKETGFPVGCFCEPELLPKEICSPPVAAPAAPAPAAPAAPAPAPVPPPVLAPVPSAEKVNIPSDALFAYDKAEISEQGRDKLGEFANRLKDINLEVVTAVGHADRIGSDTYNQVLSEKRANSVKDFLINQGIPANRIYTEGKGETQPVSGDACKNIGPENKRNRKLIDCLGVDRRVELEAVGTRNPKK